MHNTTIEHFMTRSPHTIGSDQPLSRARRLMSECGIRHLPVLEGKKLVGLVSDRDLQYVETLLGVNTQTDPVMEAVAMESYAVSPKDLVRDVAMTMAERRLGSAVVVEHERVVGVFTTVDALRALASVLSDEVGS